MTADHALSTARTPLFTVRPYVSADYGAFARIDDATKTTAFWGEADWRPIHPPCEPTPNAPRYVAVHVPSSQIVAYGAVLLEKQANIEVTVHPAWQRRGVGTMLWERMRQDLATLGAASVGPWVRAQNTSAHRWLESLGFSHVNQDGPVQLFVADADMSPFAGAEDDLDKRGIVFTTLAAELENDTDGLARFYDLFQGVGKDVVGYSPDNHMTYEQCLAEWSAPGMQWDSFFIAKHDGVFVGLSILGRRVAPADRRFAGSDKPDCLSQHLTGVLPAYRRQGIALALKRHTIQYARQHGYQRILSNSDNPAMRALNKKLGFRAGPWLVYQHEISK